MPAVHSGRKQYTRYISLTSLEGNASKHHDDQRTVDRNYEAQQKQSSSSAYAFEYRYVVVLENIVVVG